MTHPQQLILTLVLSLQSTLALANANPPVPTSSSNPVSAPPVASVAPSCSAKEGSTEAANCSVPVSPLTEDEKKKLGSEFKKAWTQQKAAFSHQERSAIRELQVAQSQKQKRWREEQKTARRKYFDQHMSGPERREYVQAYLKKKQDFENALKVELLEAKKSWTAKQQNLKQEQKSKEDQFQQALKNGQQPSPDLWPKAH
jgi:hypothetical protein